ncbi:LysR family transcriptional regulator [Chelatococcus asaccharovorans]|jgi:DNA-binding transcriptional LysR family regulator|uniref:LysR family transcriptional regulator n=1 Tax=Chelatococcus asaccharovorans TaxID=28210 RepID=UPI00224C6D42|nr:LysR family transcriptional regulator [Chelatococcus asaccharovorans]CAH1663039.1 LysR family transcriptional regulator [Chelatococcus asaccharovorans]CAH1682968.1 LysR family transcriptional regulator [Chelatococcus asaccharovorans]
MNLRQMEVFHAIMRAGSVTGAARLLNVTQPAVSAVLRHCEDQLRIKLFERTGGRLQPTPEAEAIFPDIANIFHRVETVSRVANDLAGGRLGNITVAATFAIANGPLAEAVAEFSRFKPSVRFSVHALPTHQVIDRVSRREADFGLGFGPIRDPAVEAELLASAEIACIMPIDHPLAQEEVITVEKLAGHPIITYAPHTPIGGPVETAFRDCDMELVRAVQVNYSMTAFVLAARGAGIALVEPLLLSAASMPSLVARRFEPRITVETMLIHPIGRGQTRTMQSFIDTLRTRMAATYGTVLPEPGEDSPSS